MCQLSELINQNDLTCEDVSPKLVAHFAAILGYNVQQFINNEENEF